MRVAGVKRGTDRLGWIDELVRYWRLVNGVGAGREGGCDDEARQRTPLDRHV